MMLCQGEYWEDLAETTSGYVSGRRRLRALSREGKVGAQGLGLGQSAAKLAGAQLQQLSKISSISYFRIAWKIFGK
jgi:hypothetical protein